MIRGRIRALAATIMVIVAVVGCGGGAAEPASGGDDPPVVRVAAASDLKFALDEVATALVEADPPVRVLPTYGSSGTFFHQISNGAPFDVYLSADLSLPMELVEGGRATRSDVFRYAVGRLVLWAPTGSPVDVSRGMSALGDPAVTRVAIANPEHAPYGKAAVAAMISAGVYEKVRPKLVLGENVAQAAEFAASGNAQVGVIALALALAPQLSDAGRHAEVPLDTFPRLDQGGVVLSDPTDRPADRAAAQQLRQFLTGTDGIAILKRYGFFLPDAAG